MSEQKISQEEKVWALASYLWIISLVALAARKDKAYIRFHANQGVLLFAISLVLCFIPVLGWMLNMLVAVLAIVGMIKAWQGEKWELPVLGEMAKKFGDWVIKTIKL